jgi:hypothetical protein
MFLNEQKNQKLNFQTHENKSWIFHDFKAKKSFIPGF